MNLEKLLKQSQSHSSKSAVKDLQKVVKKISQQNPNHSPTVKIYGRKEKMDRQRYQTPWGSS